MITAQIRTGLCLRAGRMIQRSMAHAQASLVGVILSSKIMSVSRFQNVPETMILHKTNLASFKEVNHRNN